MPERLKETCFLCAQAFQYGPHVYHGKRIPAWNMLVCERCLRGNWDGIVPQDSLLKYLRENGYPETYNEKGWLKWPS